MGWQLADVLVEWDKLLKEEEQETALVIEQVDLLVEVKEHVVVD